MLARPTWPICLVAAVVMTVGGCAVTEQTVDPTCTPPSQCCSQGMPVACLRNLPCYGYQPTEWRRWPTECEPQTTPICPLPAAGQPNTCPAVVPEQTLPGLPPPPPNVDPTEAPPQGDVAPTPSEGIKAEEPTPGILQEPSQTPLPPLPAVEEELPPALVPPPVAPPKASPKHMPAPQALLNGQPPTVQGTKPPAMPAPSEESQKGQADASPVRLLSLDSEVSEDLPLAPLPDEILGQDFVL
jgi:hypothetical protein